MNIKAITGVKRLLRGARDHNDAVEREKMARLEQAERDLQSLQERSNRATSILSARDRRNHWRESIELMIQGVS